MKAPNLTKFELIKITKNIIIYSSYGGNVVIDVIDNRGNSIARINSMYLKDYFMKEIKKGNFKIAESAKGNRYIKIELEK